MRYVIPLQGKLKSGGARLLGVKLVDSSVPHPGEFIGLWEFGQIYTETAELVVDLWSLDYYSMTVRAGNDTHLCKAFRSSRHSGKIGPLCAEVYVQDEYRGLKEVFKLDLPASNDDRTALQKRIALNQTPPIEWFFVELTNNCNHSCTWCPAQRMTRPKGHMSMDSAKKLFSEIADYQKKRPNFSLYASIRNPVFVHVMGEPLLHPNLFDIIDAGHGAGLEFCLVTNASMLSDSRIDKLLASGLNSIVLSLNTIDADSYKRTGSPVSYDHVVAQIQKLIRKRYESKLSGPRIEIQLLTAHDVALNVKPFVETYKQAESQLVRWLAFVRDQERRADVARHAADEDDLIRLRNINAYEAGDPRSYFTLGQNISLVFKKACNFGNVLAPDGYDVQPIQQGTCPFRNAHRVLCVMWDGSCTYCSLDYDNSVNIGNVFKDSIVSVWTGPRMTRIRRLMDHNILSEPLCQRCQGVLRHQ